MNGIAITEKFFNNPGESIDQIRKELIPEIKYKIKRINKKVNYLHNDKRGRLKALDAIIEERLEKIDKEFIGRGWVDSGYPDISTPTGRSALINDIKWLIERKFFIDNYDVLYDDLHGFLLEYHIMSTLKMWRDRIDSQPELIPFGILWDNPKIAPTVKKDLERIGYTINGKAVADLEAKLKNAYHVLEPIMNQGPPRGVRVASFLAQFGIKVAEEQGFGVHYTRNGALKKPSKNTMKEFEHLFQNILP